MLMQRQKVEQIMNFSDTTFEGLYVETFYEYSHNI
jgi:hypothetical protein